MVAAMQATASSITASAYRIPFAHRLPIPIVAGAMRGQYWIPASGGKILRVLLGSYEREQTQRFQQWIRPGDVVLDVGAANGYYTLLAAQLVGETGQVIAFEPDPKNAAFLRQHIQRNGWKNVTVLQAAVGDREGVVNFACGTGTGTGRITSEGDRQVALVRLDDVTRDCASPPTHVKIDVEGAEMQVLAGAERLLREASPILFLSTHGVEVHQACCRHLEERGYELEPIEGDDLASASEVFCRPR